MGNTRVLAVAIVSATVGILTAIISAWLTNVWIWGILSGAAAFMVSIACTYLKRRRDVRQGREAPRITVEAERDAYVAGRDIYHGKVTNVARNHPSGAIALLGSVLIIGGTLYLGTQPPGRLHTKSPANKVTTGPTSSSVDNPSFPMGKSTLAATFVETLAGGDKITQSIYLGTPQPLSQLPDVADAYRNITGSCAPNSSVPQGRDLIIPFKIVSTLNTAVQVAANIDLESGDYLDSSGNNLGLPINNNSTFGEYGSQILCASDQPTTLLGNGKPEEFDGWLIYPNAVSADAPDGSKSALEGTYVYLNETLTTQIASIQAVGNGVCGLSSYIYSPSPDNPGDEIIPYAFLPFLHISGQAPVWEKCTGNYNGSPDITDAIIKTP